MALTTMDRRIWRAAGRAVAMVLVAIVAGGCDDGIDPLFSRQAHPPDLALLPADRVGIVVQPVGGVSEPFASAMAAALATALQRQNVPASLRGGAAESYFLSGETAMTTNDDGSVTLRVTWDLTNPNGALVGTHEQRRAAPAPDERTGALLEQLAAEAAPRVAAMIQDSAPPPPVAVAAGPEAAIAIGPITGAPGSGARDLAAALAVSLPIHGVAPAAANQEDRQLVGVVTIAPAAGATQRIQLTWRVLGGDGAELGRLDQENDIAAGSLEGAWGEVAYLIADGVALGVAEILARSGG